MHENLKSPKGTIGSCNMNDRQYSAKRKNTNVQTMICKLKHHT